MTAEEQEDAPGAATAAAAGAAAQLSAAELEDWLSTPRLDTYLSRCQNDGSLALELYCWNSQLAAAALADTCHLEVALRNAYDRQMSQQFPDWSVDPASRLFTRTQGHGRAVTKQISLNTGSQRALTDAKRGLGANPSHGKSSPPPRSASGPSSPTGTEPQPSGLRCCATPSTAPPLAGEVHDRVARVNKFRNRLAHNEPVFSTSSGLHDRMRDVDELFTWVAPAAAAYVRATSTVPSLLAQCPVQGLL